MENGYVKLSEEIIMDGIKNRPLLDNFIGGLEELFKSLDNEIDVHIAAKLLYELGVNCENNSINIRDYIEVTFIKEDGYYDELGCGLKMHIPDGRHNNPGRPKIKQLCSCLSDKEVCKVFSKAFNKAKKYIDSPNQYICCFFNALFALLGTDTPIGKIKHYWEMLRDNIKGLKIPRLRTIQSLIKRFNQWKEDAKKWLITQTENIKFKTWDILQLRLETLLPEIEPRLRMAF